MRLRSFLYHFLVVSAALVLMGMAGYFSLDQILRNQMEKQVRTRTDFLQMQLNNSKNFGGEQRIIDNYGIFDGGVAWIVNKLGDFVALPQAIDSVDPQFRKREKEMINLKAAKDDVLPFEVGQGLEKRVVNSEKIQSGN